jgi:hypothetical protein
MSLQAAGSDLKFSEIQTEFGTSPNNSLGAYRVSQTISGLTNMPLDTGIPQSGEIRFSDFYSKKLNVVVDYTVNGGSSIGIGTTTKVTGRTDYDANNSKVVVIGGFRTRPSSPANTKVWLHTNSDVGSDTKTNTREYCSLLTGTWNNTTDLKIDIGPNGRVFGAGGDGGAGGNANNGSTGGGSAGNNGTSSIGISHSYVVVTNRGRIQCGGAGGGGGGAAWGQHVFYVFPQFNSRCRQADAAGSGGGGGSGLPSGSAGNAGSASASGCDSNSTANGNTGENGTLLYNGLGGAAVSASTFAADAYGGKGGDSAATGTAGTGDSGLGQGTDGSSSGGGGGGGQSGYAIVVSGPGIGVTIAGVGTTVGNIVYSTSPL